METKESKLESESESEPEPEPEHDEPTWPSEITDRFHIKSQIGQGAFGQVWEAKERKTGQKVAIKVLMSSVESLESESKSARSTKSRSQSKSTTGKWTASQDGKTLEAKTSTGKAAEQKAAQIEAFRTEFEIMQRLSAVCGAGFVCGREYIVTSSGQQYIVMEFLDGYVPLNKYAKKQGEKMHAKPEPMRSIIINLVRALDQLHDLGVVHRDMKPDNVLIHPKTLQIKLIDFGVSCTRNGSPAIPCENAAGTPLFMAPEAIFMPRGFEAAVAQDIWGLGVTIASALLGMSSSAIKRILPDYETTEYIDENGNGTVQYWGFMKRSGPGPKLVAYLEKHPDVGKYLRDNPSVAETIKAMLAQPGSERRLIHLECEWDDAGDCSKCKRLKNYDRNRCVAVCATTKEQCSRKSKVGATKCAQHLNEEQVREETKQLVKESQEAMQGQCIIC